MSLPTERDRRHSTWSCVKVEPKTEQGIGDVSLMVAVTLNCSHNRLSELTPDIVFVELGISKKEAKLGWDNMEVLGFLAFLFDVPMNQIRMQSGEKERNKLIIFSGLRHEKRELIWLLEAKLGQRHDAHFAIDKVNEQKRKSSKDALQREKEQSEFRSLREEMASANHLEAFLTSSVMQQTTGRKRALPTSPWVLKKQASDTSTVSGCKQGSGEVGARSAASMQTPAVNNTKHDACHDDAAEETSEPAGLVGLTAYDSEESSDERPSLPRPSLI